MARRLLALGLAAGLLTTRARAEEGGYAFETSTTAGYRMVDIDGAKEKYLEDYDLRSGGRLFGLDVSGAARSPDATLLDRFRLELQTPHDEPASRFRLTAGDRALWDLRADFNRSRYIYAVPQLFEQAVAGDLRLDDLHDFGLVRTNGAVDLRLRAPGFPVLLLGYGLYERHGDAITTVRIPAGDTFLVRAPVDSAAHVGRVGTEFRALATDVFLQQEYRRVDRRHDLGPVRTPLGLDPADGSRLAAFRNDQDEHLDVPATTVRLRRDLGERVEVTGAYLFSHADLGFDFARRRRGTAAVGGLPEATSAAGGGDATLDTHVADAGTTVRVSDRVRLHASYRFDERSQDGALAERGTAGLLAAATRYDVRAHSVTGDVEVEPLPTLSLRAGSRYRRRDAAFSVSGEDVSTDTVGAIGALRYRPWSILDLFARYENVQVDDPFRVPGDRALDVPAREIALTFTNRATAGFRLEPRDWIALGYELVTDSRENERFGARTRAFGNTVALTLVPLRDLFLFASYTRRDLDSRADVLLPPLYTRTASVQEGTEDVLVSELRWDLTRLGQPWSAGADVAWVRAENALRPRLEPGLLGRTFFDLDRIDGGVFLTLRHRLIEPSVEFRVIEYDERVLPRNDYRATIVAFKLTKRLSF